MRVAAVSATLNRKPQCRNHRLRRSGPAAPIRAAPPGTARASTSRCSPPTPTRVELCLFDPKGRREMQRIELTRAHRSGLALLSARSAAGPAVWLSRARPVQAGRRASLQSAQAAARPLCQESRGQLCAGAMRCSATASATGARTCRSIAATARAACPRCKVIDPAFTWGDDRRPRRALARHRDLRAARARLHHAASRRAAGAARHVCGPRHRRR